MKKKDKPLLIACGILKEEIDRLIQKGEIDVRVLYLDSNLHYDYGRLKKALEGSLAKQSPQTAGSLVVVYGDVCLGFAGEMQALMEKHGTVKVNGLNCIDCLMGGSGRLLETDPEHKRLFLNPAFIHFMGRFWEQPTKEIRETFKMLDGIVLIDALGNLEVYQEKIDLISEKTGLPILERKNVGLTGLKTVIQDALDRTRKSK